MLDRDLSADNKYYSSGQKSALHQGGVSPRVSQVSLKTATGETDSISDVSDISRVLDSVGDLFTTGISAVRVPITSDLVQKARTNLELRVGREELTYDQAASINFLLMDPIASDEPDTVVEDVVEEDVVEEEEVEEDVVEDEEDVVEDEEDVVEDEDDVVEDEDEEGGNPSIASLFGATDDDDGDD